MRKWTAFLLTLVMCLGLAACSGGETSDETTMSIDNIPSENPAEELLTREEMLSTAAELKIGEFYNEFEENKLRAETKYVGKNFIVTGFISRIDSDYIEISGANCAFIVPLTRDDLIQIDKAQKISVVGKIENVSTDKSTETQMGNSYSYATYKADMSNCHIVNDRFEVSGTLLFYYSDLIRLDGKTQHNPGDAAYWRFGLDTVDNNVVEVDHDMSEDIPVSHVPGKEIKTISISGQDLHNKDKITVSAKVMQVKEYGKPDYSLRDVELVSVNN